MRLIITMCGCLLTHILFGQETPSAFSFKELRKCTTDSNVVVRQITSYDGTSISYYQFCPEKKAVAKLIFIHGGGAHSKLGYFHLAKTLRDSFSIETILLDIRGHGISQGVTGDCPTVKSLNKDISAVIQVIKEDGSQPIYLGGHSSGGGLVLNYSSWKQKEKLDGYVFVSPELGYKSNTERENRNEFAEVKVWKFVINGMSQGLMLKHSDAVFFKYPKQIIEANPLILESITVNMSKALTPHRPIQQFENIKEPIMIFVGEKDELFDPKKVTAFASCPLETNDKTTSQIVLNKSHLSILNGIGADIGQVILGWQLD